MDFPVPSGMPVATARRVLQHAAVADGGRAALAHVDPGPPGGLGRRDDSPDGRADPCYRQDGPQARPNVARELRERLKTALDAELRDSRDASRDSRRQLRGVPPPASRRRPRQPEPPAVISGRPEPNTLGTVTSESKR